ncbi:MAG TPA: hypothetical protein VFK14_00070 [Solirubrobacterales bacterium]|nr:hypothetical protein [Solirubrobacterales bacterium]
MFNTGEKLFIRTVTFHHVGEVEEYEDGFVKLKNASWVAHSGRFGEAIANGSLSEVEYLGEVSVSVSSIVDVCPWTHELPSESK